VRQELQSPHNDYIGIHPAGEIRLQQLASSCDWFLTAPGQQQLILMCPMDLDTDRSGQPSNPLLISPERIQRGLRGLKTITHIQIWQIIHGLLYSCAFHVQKRNF
jgi:hypothetical protein